MPSDGTDPAVLDTYQAVVSAFGEFLTVAVHAILYERNIYPPSSFLSARRYNCAVSQNRHPAVCKWITDAVAAVEAELLKCTVKAITLVILSPTSVPLERFVFSTATFPRIPPTELLATFAPDPAPDPTDPPVSPPTNPPPLINLHAQFRSLLLRLTTLAPTLLPLPADCTFTLAIEMRERSDGGEAPLGRDGAWMAAEVGRGGELGGGDGLGKGGAGAGRRGGRGGKGKGAGTGVRMMPIRNVEAGAFLMEVWAEEAVGKEEAVEAKSGEWEGDGAGGLSAMASPRSASAGFRASVESEEG